MSQKTEESQEATPTLCQATPPVVFHQDAPELSPGVPPRGDKWSALPVRPAIAHISPFLTKTAAPKPAAPAAVGSGKRNSNRAQPTDNKTASPSQIADQDSDITLVVSIGESDGNSDYVKSEEISPTSPANTTDLAGYIS